jgi:hypothetical protein
MSNCRQTLDLAKHGGSYLYKNKTNFLKNIFLFDLYKNKENA